MDIVAIENDGTKVRLVIKQGDNFSYQNLGRGILRVIESTDDSLTIEHVNKLHHTNV